MRITAFDQLSLVVGTPDGTQDFGVNITQKLKSKLLDDGATSVKVTADFAGETKELNNVVGVIKGNGSTKNAVVIMAHFDHVGKQGEFLFSGILDNASGTATVMSTASKLLELTKDKKLDYDVIIAAINSEETNAIQGEFAGSDVLVNTLESNYDNITSINIDCVGNGQPIYMGNSNEQDKLIAKQLITILTTNNIEFNDEVYCASDATSFMKRNHPVITIGTLDTGEFSMHNAEMKTSDINIDELEDISKSVAELVVGGNLFTKTIDTSNLEEGSYEWFDQLRDVAAQQQGGVPLKINQFMYVDFRNSLVKIFGDTELTDLEELEAQYPTIKIPQTLSDYSFTDIEISATDIGSYSKISGKNPPDGFEKNKAYNITPNVEKILLFSIDYVNETGGLTIYVKDSAGELLESDEYRDVSLIEIPNYGSFKLIAQKGDEDYYSIAQETDKWIITLNPYSTEMSDSGFSKEEMIALAERIFSSEVS